MPQLKLLTRAKPTTAHPQQRTFDHNQMRWRVAGDYEWLLHGPDAPNWARLATCHTAELVKRNSQREVWRVSLRNHLFFAKVYFAGGWISRLKKRFRGPAGEREWRHAWFAVEHGIPAIVPVACGHPTLPGDSLAGVFVTRAVEDGLPLDACWHRLQAIPDPRASFHAIRCVTDAVARAIARAHQFHFEHYDMHIGNVLVRGAETDEPQVAFADLHTVRIGMPMTERVVVRNLAQLNQWFRRHAGEPTRLRFLKRYLDWRDHFSGETRARAGLKEDLRRLAAAMDEAARRHARRLGSKRDRRAMRSGKYFTHLRFADGWKGQAFLQSKHPLPFSLASRLSLSSEDWEHWLANPSRWLAMHERDRLVKRSSSAVVMRASLPTEYEAIEVFVKNTRPTKWSKRLLAQVRGSRDRRAWQTAYALIHRDVPTPHPLAFLERRRLGVLLESMLITEALPDTKDLDRFALDDLPRLSPREAYAAKSAITEAIVRLLRRMESRSFLHRDLKASNILVRSPRENDPLARVWLIDVDGIKLPRRLRSRDLLAPLMRLNVSFDPVPEISLTDRLRFLRRYLLAAQRTDGDWRDVWRELAQWSARKRRRKGIRELRKSRRRR